MTSFMIIAARFVLESSTSTSVFPLTVTRPRPVRYASKMLDKKEQIRSFTANNPAHTIEKLNKDLLPPQTRYNLFYMHITVYTYSGQSVSYHHKA